MPLKLVQLAADRLDNVLLQVVRPHVIVLARLRAKSKYSQVLQKVPIYRQSSTSSKKFQRRYNCAGAGYSSEVKSFPVGTLVPNSETMPRVFQARIYFALSATTILQNMSLELRAIYWKPTVAIFL